MEEGPATEPRLHVMLDIETMGTGPDAAIVAIGAVKFDPFSPLAFDPEDTFYTVVDLVSSVKCGGQIDGSTVKWWLQQSDEARKAISGILSDNIHESLRDFRLWYGEDKDVPVWGNGATFDNVIVRRAYQRLGMEAPWSHRADRCFRTLKNLFPGVEPPERSGTHHNALDDAMWQAEYMRLIFQGGTCSG